MTKEDKTIRNECRVLWFAAVGFFLLFGAWTTLFVIASHHRVAEVPLAVAQENR